MSHIELLPLEERDPKLGETFKELQDLCVKQICSVYQVAETELFPERIVRTTIDEGIAYWRDWIPTKTLCVALDRPLPRALVLQTPNQWRYSYLNMSETIRQMFKIMFYNQLLETARRDYERFRQRRGLFV